MLRLCLPGTYNPSADSDGGMAGITSSVERFETGMATARESLAVSTDPEHLLTAAFLSEAPGERLALVERALAAAPADPHLLRRAVEFCQQAGGASECPLERWEQRLLDADSQNSEAWILVATNRYERGDHAGALSAVQQAAASPETRRYWPETVALANRALGAATRREYSAGIYDALSIAFTMVSDKRRRPMCESASGSTEWVDACLRYGETLERQARVTIDHLNGVTLQLQALQIRGDNEQLAAVIERRDALMARPMPDATQTQAIAMLLYADAVAQQTWLDTYMREDEITAQAYLTEELSRHLEADDRLDCRPP
ncbi:MAG: hypothetical protein AAFN78_13985 [Pseudomonadota bacterium]